MVVLLVLPPQSEAVLTVNSQKYDSSQGQTESLTTFVPVLDKLAQLMDMHEFPRPGHWKDTVRFVRLSVNAVGVGRSGRGFISDVRETT